VLRSPLVALEDLSLPSSTLRASLPTGAIQNLYFDSNGVFYVEDLIASPGTYTVLFTSTPGSICKSITQFGREYIANLGWSAWG